MKLYSSNENYKLYHGNMLDMLEVIEPNSVDSIITDPPYELNFMGKGWDNSGIAFQKETWQKCYEVLKPGGYLLAFGGSRTFHRIACAIEDAGFEIRDTIMWLYGSGFPKSMDISKQIDKRGGESTSWFGEYLKNTLKEKNMTYSDLAKHFLSKTGGITGCVHNWVEGKNMPTIEQFNKICEILDLPFKKMEEAEREVIGHITRTKGIGIPACGEIVDRSKYNYNITTATTDLAKQWNGWGTALKPSFEPIIVARKPFKGSLVDNVIEYGVGGINIDECRVEFSNNEPDNRVGKIDVQKGAMKNPWGAKSDYDNTTYKSNGRFPANTILTYDEIDFDEVCGGFPNTKTGGGIKAPAKNINTNNATNFQHSKKYEDIDYVADSGSASRYFMNCKYTEKDEEIWKQLLVNNVGNNLEILKATKDNIVQMNVEGLLKELKDHYAKYVENQLDLIKTSIVQDIAKMLTWDFKIETSQVIQDFIINSKKCSQFLKLVQFVEKMDNIDTTQTTQNLLKLFGYVKVAITNYIVGNFTVNELDQKRYTYQPKASKKDRDEGCQDLEDTVNACSNQAIAELKRGNDTFSDEVNSTFNKVYKGKNTHPTVKPTELMQYLVRLVSPDGATILDCFNGSGSTGKAVMYENREKNKNYKYIGIELTEEYLPIAKARIEYVCNLPIEKDNQLTIFDFID